MSESEDDEIFDDEEASESEHSGSINNSQLGSEFDEQNGMKSPKEKSSNSNEDDFADPENTKKKANTTDGKKDFVTVPVTGKMNNSIDSPDGRDMSPSIRKELQMDEEEMEEMYEQDLGKLNWQEIFLEEKMSGEP